MSVPCLLLSLIANVYSLLKLFSLFFHEGGFPNVDVKKVSQIQQEIPITLCNRIYSYSNYHYEKYAGKHIQRKLFILPR